MKAKKVYEAFSDVLKPKSEDEIGQSMEDKYGFVPSEESRIMTQLGEYPIEYHMQITQDGNFNHIGFYKTNPEKKYSSYHILEEDESNWLISMLRSGNKLVGYDIGKGWEKAKKQIEWFDSL